MVKTVNLENPSFISLKQIALWPVKAHDHIVTNCGDSLALKWTASLLVFPLVGIVTSIICSAALFFASLYNAALFVGSLFSPTPSSPSQALPPPPAPPKGLPFPSTTLHELKDQLATPDGWKEIRENPSLLLSLIPCHNKEKRDVPSTLSTEAIYQTQTDPNTASRYLAGVLIFLEVLGLTLNKEGFFEKIPGRVINEDQMRMLSTALISLSEHGFGLLAREILATIRLGDDFLNSETAVGNIDASRSWLRPAERALTTGSLAGALPKKMAEASDDTKILPWWEQTHTVSHWGSYLQSSYFNSKEAPTPKEEVPTPEETQPSSQEPNLPPQVEQAPQWFSLSQVLSENASRSILYPSRHPDVPAKHRTLNPLERDPIFGQGHAPALLVWNNDKWEFPFL